MKIKRFNESVENITLKAEPVIEHYFLRQQMEIKGLTRKIGDGTVFIINNIGIIKNIRDFGDDIGYEVEFPIETEHSGTYGSKWTNKTTSWTVFHIKDKDKIVSVK